MFKFRTSQLEAELASLREELVEARKALQADASAVVERESSLVSNDPGFGYRALVEQMHEGAATINSAGLVLYANQGLAELIRRPLASVVGAAFHRFFMPPDDAWIGELQAECLASGREGKTEALITRPDGAPVPVTLTFHASDLRGARTLSVIVRDLTEHLALARAKARRENEEALKASEKRYRDLVNMSPEPIAVHADGKWLFGNAAALALFGAPSAEEFIGKWVLDMIHPADRADAESQIRVLSPGKEARTPLSQMRMRRLDGSQIDVEATGIGIDFEGRPAALVVLRDVTEKKQAEDVLRASEERYRSTLDQMIEGCAILSPDWTYLYANEANASHAHLQREDMIGHSMLKLLPGVESSPFFMAYRCCMQERIPQVVEAKYTFASGAFAWYEVRVRPVPEGIFVLSMDVTERKLAEELLEQRVAERTADLDRANRALRMIMECNRTLVRTQDEQELVQQICGIVRRMGGFWMAWVGYAEADEGRTVRPVVWDGAEGGYLEQARITWADEPRGRGPTGSCIRLREVRLNRDFQTEPEVAPWRENALRHGLRSSLALPLVWRDEVFGALTIYSDRPDDFDEYQVKHLAELAEDLAFGIMAIRTRSERDQARAVAEQRSESLRALATELFQTEHRERQKLAKILHDQMQQLLVAARFGLVGLTGRVQDEGLLSACSRVEDMIAQAIQTSRTLALDLSPPALHEKGLLAAVEWLGQRMQERHGLTVEVTADENHDSLDPQYRAFLFDAIGELLFNVVKHAGVDRAQVHLTGQDGRFEVSVQDGGAGFAVSRIGANSGGFGLFSIQERLKYLGGQMQVESTPRPRQPLQAYRSAQRRGGFTKGVRAKSRTRTGRSDSHAFRRVPGRLQEDPLDPG